MLKTIPTEKGLCDARFPFFYQKRFILSIVFQVCREPLWDVSKVVGTDKLCRGYSQRARNPCPYLFVFKDTVSFFRGHRVRICYAYVSFIILSHHPCHPPTKFYTFNHSTPSRIHFCSPSCPIGVFILGEVQILVVAFNQLCTLLDAFFKSTPHKDRNRSILIFYCRATTAGVESRSVLLRLLLEAL